jgi:addiction module RelB/DinJ family antitoxin
MMKTETLKVQVDSELKEGADEILEEIGLDMSGLVNMTLRKVITDRGLPFRPHARTEWEQAVYEVETGQVESANSLEEMWTRLDEDD